MEPELSVRFGENEISAFRLQSQLKEPDAAVNAATTSRAGEAKEATESNVWSGPVPGRALQSQKVESFALDNPRRC